MNNRLQKGFTLFSISTLFIISGCSSSLKWTKEDYGLLKNKNFFADRIELIVPSTNDSLSTYIFWRIFDGLPLKEIQRKIEAEKSITITIDEAADFLQNKREKLQTSDDLILGSKYFWQSSNHAYHVNAVEIIYVIQQAINGGHSGLVIHVKNKDKTDWRILNTYSAAFILGYAVVISGGGREGVLNSMNSFVKNVASHLKEN